jgi:hypothetical protein
LHFGSGVLDAVHDDRITVAEFTNNDNQSMRWNWMLANASAPHELPLVATGNPSNLFSGKMCARRQSLLKQ